MQIDDDGLVQLLRGAIVQAERDAKDGDQEAMIFLQYMKGEHMSNGDTMTDDWVNRQLAQVDTTGPRRTATVTESASPFEGMDAAKLDALGVSTQWAGKTAAELDEMARQQAHRDRAGRLGVDYRYLPMEEI